MRMQDANKMPATILALIGGILMSYALMGIGVNIPVDCGDINQPEYRSLFALIAGFICGLMALRLWLKSAYIVFITLSVGIFGFIFMQINKWDAYAGTIAGCAF